MSDKNQLAKDRTDWAEDRTVLANERTFAGWMRTGMASVGVAIGLKAVFGEFEPTWAAKAVATLFIVLGIAIFLAARGQACRTLTRLHEHDTEAQPTRFVTWLSISLSVAAAAVGVILWLL